VGEVVRDEAFREANAELTAKLAEMRADAVPQPATRRDAERDAQDAAWDSFKDAQLTQKLADGVLPAWADIPFYEAMDVLLARLREWERSRVPSDTDVEAAARAICGKRSAGGPHVDMAAAERGYCMYCSALARAALEAVRAQETP
jgi:hypothetical protein